MGNTPSYPCVVPGCKKEVEQIGFLCREHAIEEEGRRTMDAIEAYKARRAQTRAALQVQS